jgi:hypothetical protein
VIVTDEYRANYAEIEWGPIVPSKPRTRQENVAPYVISDTMDGTWHPVTGEMIDSKHKFREITRSAGCDEVGNERMTPRTPTTVPPVGPDIKRAIEELRGR